MTRLRDAFGTWPSLKLHLQLAPWHWRLVPFWYRDDVSPTYLSLSWLMAEVELTTNHSPMWWTGVE